MAKGTLTKAQRERVDADASTRDRIKETLTHYEPGGWAQQVAYGPACSCGVKAFTWAAEGGGKPSGICQHHPYGRFVSAGEA